MTPESPPRLDKEAKKTVTQSKDWHANDGLNRHHSALAPVVEEEKDD